MTVSVGLGTGDRQQTISNMQLIGQLQEKVLPLGMADKKSIYNGIRRGVEAMGYKDVSQFFTEPQDGAMPQPGPSPDAIKAEIEKQKDTNTHEENMLKIALEAVIAGAMSPDMFMAGFMSVVQKDAASGNPDMNIPGQMPGQMPGQIPQNPPPPMQQAIPQHGLPPMQGMPQ
jgi:hypothetical protein